MTVVIPPWIPPDLERDLKRRGLWPDPMPPDVRANLEAHIADPHPGCER